MAKVVLGVILGLAGISMIIVSIWLLVDIKHPKMPGLHFDRGYSPIIGVAASCVLMISGILCCCVSKANLRRALILTGVLLAFGLTVACCVNAVFTRIKANSITDDMKPHIEEGSRHKLLNTVYAEEVTKYKTQLVLMAVIAGLDILVEVVALITAYRWKDTYYP